MKKSILLCTLIMAVIFTSCKTTIPTNDSINPTFTVMFSGDGVEFRDLTINDPEFDTTAVYLKRNIEYTIAFSGKDAGGVKRVTWEFPKNNINLIDPPFPNDTWSEGLATATTRTIIGNGNRMDPRSSMIFSSKLVPENQEASGTESVAFNYTVEDFSGNTLSKTLIVVIGAGPTRIGNR